MRHFRGRRKKEKDCLGASTVPLRLGKTIESGCFDGRSYHKAHSPIVLAGLPLRTSVDKCYLNELGSCDGGISGEHLISASIMALLADDGDFTISGLPWIPAGETRAIGPKSLTANRLCRKHNSCLHPLDDAALKFFTALKSCLERKTST
jgi:hypothetical protein